MPSMKPKEMPNIHGKRSTLLSEFLKKIRKDRDWSQYDLAEVLSVNQSYCAAIEVGKFKKMPLDYIKSIHDKVLTNEEKEELMMVLYSSIDEYLKS